MATVPLKAFALAAAALVALTTPVAAQEGVRIALRNEALKHRGVPYVYGAMSPRGFDCSGFTSWVYQTAAGMALPRTARGQASAGTAIPLSAAKPGDLLIFDTVGGRPSHVGILLEDKSFAHAASAGPKTGIIVSSLDEKYYASRLVGVRRLLAGPPAVATATASPGAATASPGAATASPGAPAAPASAPIHEALGEPILLSISDRPEVVNDRIPAARGSSLGFLLKNNTGKTGTFEILFYKLDKDPSKHRTLRRDRVRIIAGELCDLAPLTFPEEGQYRLVIKTHDNFKRLERTWAVRGL